PSPSASSSTLLAAISVAWMSPVSVKVIEGSVCFEMGMRLATAAWSRLRIARWHCPRLTSRSVALTESEFRPGSPLVVDRSSLVMSGPLSSGFIALELLSQSGAVLPGTGGSSRSGLRGTVQDLLDLRRQDIGLERLHDVPVDVGLDGLDDVLFLIGRGDHEDRQLRMLRARADRLDQLEAIHHRHGPVRDHEFDRVGGDLRQRRLSVVGLDHRLVADRLEVVPDDPAHGGRVVDDQDSHVHSSSVAARQESSFRAKLDHGRRHSGKLRKSRTSGPRNPEEALLANCQFALLTNCRSTKMRHWGSLSGAVLARVPSPGGV